MTDEIHDLSSEDRSDLEKRELRRSKRNALDLENMVARVEGRRFLYRIMEESGVFRQSFNTNGLQMAFNEGARSIGNLVLMEILKTTPQTFHQMLREHDSDVKSDQKK